MGRLVSVAEASRVLGVSYQTVYNRIYDGSIVGKRVGGRWVVDLENVIADKREQEGVSHLDKNEKAMMRKRIFDLENKLNVICEQVERLKRYVGVYEQS